MADKYELTEDIIHELKAKHGDELVRVGSASGPLVFRPPSRPEWERFVDTVSSDKRGATRSAPMRRLVVDCFVWPSMAAGGPDLAALHAMLDRQPGLVATIVGELSELAGASDAVDVGKL